jgi:hypothetical protein
MGTGSSDGRHGRHANGESEGGGGNRTVHGVATGSGERLVRAFQPYTPTEGLTTPAACRGERQGAETGKFRRLPALIV